jgi:DNA-binding IclR family transcriptional regulator
LDLLLAFSAVDRDLTARELGQRVGLHRSTAHRIATYLAARGFLTQNSSTSRFRLGLRLVELGALAARQTTLRNLARPHLEALAASTSESVFLGVRDHDEVVHLDVIDSTRPGFFLTTQPGRRVPLHSSSTGKALLAWLSDDELRRIVRATGLPRFTQRTLTTGASLSSDLRLVRAHGYAIDDEETQEGAVGVAAPILDSSGSVVAALSLAGPPVRIRNHLDQLAVSVKSTASAISSELGYVAPAEQVGAG